MRLDLFLKSSRLCPRRTVAQRICEAGRVLVNGSPGKSSHTVKAGDEIQLRTHTRIKNILVLSVPASRQTSRQEAAELFEVLSEKTIDETD